MNARCLEGVSDGTRRTVFSEASMNPFFKPWRNVSAYRSCTSPMSMPRTRWMACSRTAQLCSVSLPYNARNIVSGPWRRR